MKKAIDLFLHPHPIAMLILAALSIGLLIPSLSVWADSFVCYAAYFLSGYTLFALCYNFSDYIAKLKRAASKALDSATASEGKLGTLLSSLRFYDSRMGYTLYVSLLFNLVYSLFKLICGLYYSSIWMVSLGIYYAVLAFARFLLVVHRRKGTDEGAYRFIAWLLNFLTITMTGIFIQMVIKGQSYSYPGILIYVMAMWAFYKIISAAINLIKRRKDENPSLAAARSLSFAGALMSILALQTAMISQFGGDAPDFARTMNAVAGAVITALMITLSAYMIAKSAGKLQSK